MRRILESGFTLIELLVVITMIVVLLALLTPALDQSIYQAELAVCGAQQKGIIAGGQQYAVNFKRHYPHRAGMRTNWEPEFLYVGNPNGPQHDTRKAIKGYVDLKALVDPLCKEVDLSLNSTNTNTDPNQIWVISSYNLWWDAQYNSGTVRFKGMFKVGDKFTWRDLNDPQAPELAFGLILNDRDSYNPAPGLGNEAHFSHPDADGVLVNVALQDEPFTVGPVSNLHVTISFWRGETTHLRGPVDGNYGYDDGSVQRKARVGIADERMVRIPEWMNHNSWTNGNGWGTQVPRVN
jgi:prepilin-type N-terminal cleavage/methylation domain-containing protein